MPPNIRPLNRRAMRHYGEFWKALQAVADALADAERLAAKATDTTGKGAAAGMGGKESASRWAAATPEEMRAAAKKAGQSLHIISAAAKRWEAELISREWRR